MTSPSHRARTCQLSEGVPLFHVGVYRATVARVIHGKFDQLAKDSGAPPAHSPDPAAASQPGRNIHHTSIEKNWPQTSCSSVTTVRRSSPLALNSGHPMRWPLACFLSRSMKRSLLLTKIIAVANTSSYRSFFRFNKRSY